MTNNQVQIELSNVIDKDIVKIATSFSEIGMINSNYVKELILHIKLLNEYDFDYLQNEELIDIFQILINELKSANSPLNIAFSVCLKYLSKEEKEFEKAIFVNTFFLSSKENMRNVFLIYEYFIGDNELELYKKMIFYVFNRNFLELEESIQIESIYKMWYSALTYFNNIEASKYAYKHLLKLFHQALHYKKSEVAFWLYYNPLNFFKNGVNKNIDIANEELKNEVEKPLEKYITEYLMPKYSIKENNRKIDKNKKIKVAFVMQRILEHSTINVLYSLIKALIFNHNNKYEFILYDLAFAEANGSDIKIIQKFKNLGITYINLNEKIFKKQSQTYSLVKKCLKTREILINDNIDILIGLHTRVEYIFLYTTRTAPKQIYWYHSSNAQYDVKGIDFRIKHGDFEKDIVIHDKKEFLQFGDIVDKSYLNPEISKVLIEKEKSKFPKNSIIMGTIGRLSKIDSKEYIEIIDDILEKNPNTIYIAAGNGDKESIKSKIKEQTISRWFFVGQINAHLYGNIIDVWPNTFPVPQGLSTLEFMAKGKPVLTMKNDFHDFEVQNAANLKRTDKFKEFKMNVDNINDYSKSLELLIKSEEAREVTGKLNLDYIEKFYYDTTSSTQRFYEILEEVIK